MNSNIVSKFAPIILVAALLLTSCNLVKKTDENPPKTNNSNDNGQSNVNKTTSSGNAPDGPGDRSANQNTVTGNAVAKAACMTTDVGKRAVQKSQTFFIDFEPFKRSCFVSTYNPEYGDIHMESQFDIYKAGKKIFSFPDQFNGSTFGCWVDGVAFQDLNHDGLTDVIVVGKCAAKAGDYNENMVYVNTGKTFTTRADANEQLSGLKTIKEITDFVEGNQQIFF